MSDLDLERFDWPEPWARGRTATTSIAGFLGAGAALAAVMVGTELAAGELGPDHDGGQRGPCTEESGDRRRGRSPACPWLGPVESFEIKVAHRQKIASHVSPTQPVASSHRSPAQSVDAFHASSM